MGIVPPIAELGLIAQALLERHHGPVVVGLLAGGDVGFPLETVLFGDLGGSEGFGRGRGKGGRGGGKAQGGGSSEEERVTSGGRGKQEAGSRA